MTHLSYAALFALALTVTAIACTGEDPRPSGGATSGGTNTSGGTTTTSGGTTSGSVDPGDGGPCVRGCKNASVLATCTAPDETCQFGCSTEGGSHCTRIYPSGAVPPEMLTLENTGDVTFANSRGNVTTGELSTLRAPNKTAADLEVKNGIGFQRITPPGVPPLSIWTFKSFVVPVGVIVHFSNENPVVFVAQREARIFGVIDLRGHEKMFDNVCGTEQIGTPLVIVGGPGGGNGAVDGATGSYTGPGVGKSGAGPGGGGFGANGQDGIGAKGGIAYGTETLVPLVGGSGGGGVTYSGGGGGGAFQLVAGTKVIIGDGTNVGGINAGGCGGRASLSDGVSAGAGGSGGAILLETPALEIFALSGLAANGGNAAGIHGAKGADPLLSNSPIGVPDGVGQGGTGAAYGGNLPAKPPGNAGGGSVGRIRINLRTPYSLADKAILSPSLPASPATSGPTSIGTIDIH